MHRSRKFLPINWIAIWEGYKNHRMLRLGILVLTPVAVLIFALLVFVLVGIGLLAIAWFFIGCPVLWAQDVNTGESPPVIYGVIQETAQLNDLGSKIAGTITPPKTSGLQQPITIIGKARCQSSLHGDSIAQILWSHIKLPNHAKAYPLQRPLTLAIHLPRCELKQGMRLNIKDPELSLQKTMLNLAAENTEKPQKSTELSLSRDRRVNTEEVSTPKPTPQAKTTKLPHTDSNSPPIANFPLTAPAPKSKGASNIQPPQQRVVKNSAASQTAQTRARSPVTPSTQPTADSFQPPNLEEDTTPEPIPDPPEVEVEVTRNGCPPRIDEPHDRVIIQTRSISRQSGRIIQETDCSDTEKVFPINKDYQCPNCQDDVRHNSKEAFSRFQKYWIDEVGQLQYINERLYVDETSPYPLVEEPGDCPYDIDWNQDKVYPQVETVYFDRTNTRKVVQACHRKVGQDPHDIAWIHQGCGLTHDFPNNQSRELQRAVFNKDGVEHEARSCRPRGDALPHQFVTSVCEPIRDVDGRTITQMARRKVTTSLGDKFITQDCEPHGNSKPLQSTSHGCANEYVHDWGSGRSYTKVRWYHSLRGQREYVTSCLRSDQFFPHQREVVDYAHDDNAKHSKAKTIIYIEPSEGQRLEISHPQIRDEDPLPYTYVDASVESLSNRATQEDCYLVTPEASFSVYQRADGSEFKHPDSELKPIRTYNCSEHWEYITRLSSGGQTQDVDHQYATGRQYKRKVIYFPDGKLHSRGKWQLTND